MLRSRFLRATLVLPPTAALLVAAYLSNHPLPSSYTPPIKSHSELSSTCATSKSLKTVNPRDHPIVADTRSLVIEKKNVQELSDEEILARFTRGFFGGWIFAPEKHLLSFLHFLGWRPFSVKFTGVATDGPLLTGLGSQHVDKLPEQGTKLFDGNFCIIDKHLNETGHGVNSFVDVAYGSDQSSFSGFHRFEVMRAGDGAGKQQDKVTQVETGEFLQISFSSMCCNPSTNRLPFHSWAKVLHEWYALQLFRDGVREIMA